MASECPHHKLRSDLPELTARIAALPVDARGYPIPFFVGYVDGQPEFRMADGHKFTRCVKERLCWVCGQPLGSFMCFPIGPMCAVNQTTAEPPSHKECAEWSVRGCPFLAKPQMVRRTDDKIEQLKAENPSAGIPIDRNPGVTCLWTTKSYQLFPDGAGGRLFKIGPMISVSWWREGRPATRDEVIHSVNTGLPRLQEFCFSEGDRLLLKQHLQAASLLYPL